MVREIKDKNTWEGFLRSCSEKTFLDSWNWGEFQKKEGSKIWRFGFFEKEELIGIALVLKVKAKRGAFLFVPHGPVIKKRKEKVLRELLEKAREIKEETLFLRVAPILERNKENRKLFEDLGFKKAPLHIHPEVSWELDIAPSEEDLLKDMRKTTRYLIKKAGREKDIEVVQTQNMEDLETFDKIYRETASRHSFVPFSLSFLKNQFSVFKEDNQIAVFLGKYKGETVSAAVVVFWQNRAFYHHGASLSKYRKIPVSYLLQWEGIKEAKRRGCQKYNFWGIAPGIKDKEDLKESGHPWAGLTLFKTGFSGYRKEYLKTRDFPFSFRYLFPYFIERIRKAKRGY